VFDDTRRCQRQKHARAARHLNRVVQVVEVGHRELRLSATATGRVQSATSPARSALSPPTHTHTHTLSRVGAEQPGLLYLPRTGKYLLNVMLN